MKYMRPLYESLASIDLDKTVELFEELKNSYHPIGVKCLEGKVLKEKIEARQKKMEEERQQEKKSQVLEQQEEQLKPKMEESRKQQSQQEESRDSTPPVVPS